MTLSACIDVMMVVVFDGFDGFMGCGGVSQRTGTLAIRCWLSRVVAWMVP